MVLDKCICQYTCWIVKYIISRSKFTDTISTGIPITTFSSFFMIFVVMSIIAVVILFVIRKRLETMMHGIR